MLYQVRFLDNTVFNGGEIHTNSKWKEIPIKPIKQITFCLPDGNLLTLRDYEEYNHFYEATKDFFGSSKFTQRYLYLMGKKNGKVKSYRVTLFETKDSKFKIGDITSREYESGKEYSGKPTAGWKTGIKDEKN
jgi:hypothetical protein